MLAHYSRMLQILVVLLVGFQDANASPAEDFGAGVRAFERKNYPQALELFQRAENAGMDSGVLLFNLGSVYYRLEQYRHSQRYFDRLINDPELGALAAYNLGLIAHKTGKEQAAIEYFERCAESTNDPDLRVLAYRQIEKLAASATKSWFAYASVAYGYDSNITILPSSSASEEAGYFVQPILLADWRLSGNVDQGLHATAFYVERDYRGSNSFDDERFNLGAVFHQRLDTWRLEYGTDYAQSTFGGEDYLNETGLFVRANDRLPGNRELRLHLRLEDISKRSEKFEFLDGDRQLFEAEYRLRPEQQEYRFEYAYEANDRINTAAESFSPERHTIGVRYYHDYGKQTRLGAGFDFRVSDYRQVPTQNRRDERARMRIHVKHRLNTSFDIQAELLFTDNQSSEPASEYDKYQLTFSGNALF